MVTILSDSDPACCRPGWDCLAEPGHSDSASGCPAARRRADSAAGRVRVDLGSDPADRAADPDSGADSGRDFVAQAWVTPWGRRAHHRNPDARPPGTAT